MKYTARIFLLVAAVAICVHAEPEPAKGEQRVFRRFRSAGDVQEARNAEAIDEKTDTDANGGVDANVNGNANKISIPKKGSSASSGRLFLKKFSFSNVFGQQQKQPQPIIPIIITSGTSPSISPIITSTGSIPTATGTVSTTPTLPTSPTTPTSPVTGTSPPTGTSPATATSPATGTSPATATSPAAPVTSPAAPVTSPAAPVVGGRDVIKRQKEQVNVDSKFDEQQLQAAFAAGAQEYVVVDQEIRGTSTAKAAKGPARVNLRRPGVKNGQMVTVRIPARYRNYFKNGQKVMLSTNRRPAKRRVVQRRRVNRLRRRKVGGKRRRVNN